MRNMDIIVNRIEELRRQFGITKKGLAEKMGISQSSVCNWYYADVIPSLSNIENVCKALNITVEQFFSGIDGVNSSKSEEKFLDEWRMLTNEEKLAVEKVIAAFKADKAVQND